MTDFLISPAEHSRQIKALGRVSTLPEKKGADVAWFDRDLPGLVGVQRKEVSDLVASVQDGRLGREIAQLMACRVSVLIVEGRPKWTPEGMLVHRYTRWSRAAHRSLLRSIQGRGIFVEYSDSLTDTAELIQEIARWVGKGDHLSLDRRPNPGPDRWGQVTDEAWACHMLQSVPDIGPVQAKAIWNHFGGALPVTLSADRDDLLAVPGLGPKRVDKIVKAFGGKVPKGS